MLLAVYRYLMGYLDVEITGRQPERLVNLAVDHEMDLWNLAWRNGLVRGRIQLADFLAIRPLARRARCRVRVRGRHGVPFLLKRIRQRRGLLAGAAACAGIVLWFSTHLWVVEVRGTEYLDPRAVRAVLADLGMRPGAFKPGLRPEAIEQQLPERLPQVSWLAVRIDGTRAVVEVVEQYTFRPLPPLGRVDIVAGRPCRVTEVVVFDGQSRVQVGDEVQPGQLLIEGGLYIRSQVGPVLPGHPRPQPDRWVRDTVAKGRVRALCTYAEEAEVPLWTETRAPGDQLHRRLLLRWNGKEIPLFGGQGPPFADYQESAWRLRVPSWRNYTPTVEIHWITAREEQVTRHPLSLETARQAAEERLLQRLLWRLSAHDRVHATHTEVLAQQDDRATIRTVVETIEDIGQPVPVSRVPLPHS